MRTFTNKRYQFKGTSNGSLCFVSKRFDDEEILCGVSCKLVDASTGNVAILTLRQEGNVEAEWTFSTIRKADAQSIKLPEPSYLIEEAI